MLLLSFIDGRCGHPTTGDHLKKSFVSLNNHSIDTQLKCFQRQSRTDNRRIKSAKTSTLERCKSAITRRSCKRQETRVEELMLTAVYLVSDHIWEPTHIRHALIVCKHVLIGNTILLVVSDQQSIGSLADGVGDHWANSRTT